MSAEKSDKPEAAAPAAAGGAPGTEAAPKGGGGIAGFLPLIIALVLAPVISWVVAEFVLLPRMKLQLAAALPAQTGGDASSASPKAEPAHGEAPKAEHKAEGKKPEAAEGEKKGGAHGGAASAGSYKFESVVVNLAGTMGTRYLKTSFLVTGKDNLGPLFEEKQPQLLDATLNTLGSLTLADLEEVGSRNLIRARLIAAYNEVLGLRVVEQIYFSDFVVQ